MLLVLVLVGTFEFGIRRNWISSLLPSWSALFLPQVSSDSTAQSQVCKAKCFRNSGLWFSTSYSYRSALINLGYEVSNSHTGPNTLKTNAPNSVLWDVIRAWAFERNPVPESSLPDPSPARILLSKPRDTWTSNIKFDVREDANPPSRETRVLRYQQNRNKNFGPGIRSKFNVSSLLEKRLRNQNRRKNIKLKLSKSW